MKYELLGDSNFKVDPRIELINTARNFYKQGWMPGTTGNLSARLYDNSFWVTSSNSSRGLLSQTDFVRIYPDDKAYEKFPDANAPREIDIHSTIYKIFPQAKFCYAICSINASLVSSFTQEYILTLPPLGILRALGISSKNLDCTIPIFDNHFEVSQISTEIEKFFESQPAQIPALLIRDHSFIIWADSLEVAQNYTEVIEYIFSYMVSARKLNVARYSENNIFLSRKRANRVSTNPHRPMEYGVGF
jgi:methylthioribulose-1-phosphate dehydratase